MIDAYTELHRVDCAHSVEVWHAGELAGGLYGVAIQGLFAGESMFTRVRDASKVALSFATDRLNERGFRLFDVQYLNDHTRSLGAIEITREQYLRRLRAALRVNCSFV
jgi:leucyl/phenylalanyl-tRNA--protein transferase